MKKPSSQNQRVILLADFQDQAVSALPEPLPGDRIAHKSILQPVVFFADFSDQAIPAEAIPPDELSSVE